VVFHSKKQTKNKLVQFYLLLKSQQKIDNKALLHYRYKCLIMVDQNQQGGGPSLVVTVFKMG
jgi:hypothetical protein